MGNGNVCLCGSIPRRHLDYECALKRIDPVMYSDGWNSLSLRAKQKVTDDLAAAASPSCSLCQGLGSWKNGEPCGCTLPLRCNTPKSPARGKLLPSDPRHGRETDWEDMAPTLAPSRESPRD